MVQIFNYENCPIQFEIIDGHVMANATLMFKAGNARLDHWKAAENTIRYIEACTRKMGISENQIVTTRFGSTENGGGTWIHEKLILNAARYISVDFEIWCDEKMSELLRTGSVSIRPSELTRMDLIKMALAAEEENMRLSETVAILSPKAEYTDKVLLSEGSFTTTDIADELGMSAIKLNRLLVYKGIQRKTNSRYVLYAKYQGKGYATTRTHPHTGSDGVIRTTHLLVWTEKGRVFLHNLVNHDLSWSQPGRSKSVATA